MKTAWYVDDDQEMIQAVRLMLKLLNINTRSFLSARDAAKILQYGERPDMLILDIHMPEISGLDMLEYVRRNPNWRRIPVIILSSEASEIEIERAMDLGADAYICKPVTLDELEAALAKASENRKKKRSQK
jgi:CheY-like chemotaxis protein